MDLTILLPLVRSTYSELPGTGGQAIVLEEAKAALVAALAEEHPAPVLLITARQSRAVSYAEQLQAWLGPAARVHSFPEPDVLPYEHMDPDGQVVVQRIRALHALLQGRGDGSPLVVVAPIHALASRTVSPDQFRAATVQLRGGARLDWERTAAGLLQAGYRRVETVQGPGELARRGGIIDVFPPHVDEPVRVELWGDEIDSLRLFDAASQRSIRIIESVLLPPARELIGNLEQFTQGQEPDSYWAYAPLLNHTAASAYLPFGSLVVLDEPGELRHSLEALHEQADAERAELILRGELTPGFPDSLVEWPELMRGIQSTGNVRELGRWGGEEEEALGFSPLPGYAGKLREALTDVSRAGRARERVVIVSHQSQRLAELLTEAGFPAKPAEELATAPEPGGIALVHGALPGGWKLALPEGHLRLITDAELFGFVKEGRRRPSRRAAVREHPLQGLAPGDFLVHVEHGIGRFVDTVTMDEQAGARKEYLLLAYAGGGRLFVPTDQIDRVTRYVAPGGHQPALSHLGTQEWERAKARVKAAAADVAKELLQTTAARQAGNGTAFSSDSVWQQELEASFPYVETPDQLQAVHDVKGDMERPQPMDRLVCGDVGYGKTEVAVRAAFKAIQDGTQVAVLVPTTVLTQQHYQTFSQRLSAFPVKVAALSRFQSDREQQEVIQGLRSGMVDVVIGTHRLLQKDVEFRNLGLVVVDEEQRFGVTHKEHFKRLRRAVDVLTLSATPIPRTLYMSMVGVRDMSVMETPPEERLAIKTYVMEYDEGTVRQAILRELERGGQVFFVHNRVQTMGQVVYRLRQLVPEATFGVAHGQMPEELLERSMMEFTEGGCDVLACSTIIESGLDLPNVNTILINDADKLGLSQLYQLRGRVGRGSSRAYAYLLYTRNKALTEQAEKRLQAVFEATELGAGYYIAMKDLEIRGAGNLLGVEQSGHIGAIGFDLYCRILATAVEDAKAEQAGLPAPSQTPVPPPVTLDLRLAAYLPEDYVPDLDTRLEIYRRLAAATELAEAEEMEQELYDRFGPLPVPAEHLLLGVRARVLARRAGVESISRRDHEVVIQLLEGLRVDSEALRGLRGVRPGSTQVRATATEGPEQWGPVVEQALSRLAEKGSEPRPSGSDGPQSTPRDAKPVRQGRRPSRH